MKPARLTSLGLALAIAAGCAGPDTERTATEGALLGTAGGAVVGAGVGYLVGGGRGAGYGAAIGGATGLVGGAILGKHVARRKEEFARAADYVDACIAAAYNADQQLILHNHSLGQHLAELDSEIAESAQQQPAPNPTLIASQRQVVAADLRAADARLTEVNEEIGLQSAVLENEAPAQTPDRVRRLQTEIDSLQQRKQELEKMVDQLHAMDNRMLASQ